MANLTPEELDLLHRYSSRYGRTWKSTMREHWAASSGGPVVQGLRNDLGLKWLKAFRLPPASQAPARIAVIDATTAYRPYLPQSLGRNLNVEA